MFSEEILLGWLIKTNKKEISEYYSIDKNSGGYPCWTAFLSNAEIFSNKEDAISVLENSSCFNKSTKMSNGIKYPPLLIHIAAGINNLNPIGNVTISVVPLIVGEPAISKKFTGQITKPEEVT